MFGRLAVVFFLVLSGFSLAISPARHGWRTGGVGRFLRRRAWRILPPYWAALAMSLAVSLYMVPASHHGPPTGSSVLVYGLVLQDVLFFAPTPNGAFWSIGVEAELYLLFPLILLVRRRFSAAVAVACVTLPVIARGLLAPAPTRSRATTGSPRISPPCSSRVWWGGHRRRVGARPAAAVGVVRRPGRPARRGARSRPGLRLDRGPLLLDRPRHRPRHDDADRRRRHRPTRPTRPAVDRPAAADARRRLLQPLPDPPADRPGGHPPSRPACRGARPAHLLLHPARGPARLGGGGMAVLPDLRTALQAQPILEVPAGSVPAGSVPAQHHGPRGAEPAAGP